MVHLHEGQHVVSPSSDANCLCNQAHWLYLKAYYYIHCVFDVLKLKKSLDLDGFRSATFNAGPPPPSRAVTEEFAEAGLQRNKPNFGQSSASGRLLLLLLEDLSVPIVDHVVFRSHHLQVRRGGFSAPLTGL